VRGVEVMRDGERKDCRGEVGEAAVEKDLGDEGGVLRQAASSAAWGKVAKSPSLVCCIRAS